MANASYRYNRPLVNGEQQLYEHLLACANAETPEQLLERFRLLFIDAVGYPERDITAVLDTIVNSTAAREDFRFILNRCCHILINRWQARPQLQAAIPQLVALLDAEPQQRVREITRSKGIRNVRSLVRDFRDTEQFLTLQRLALVTAEGASYSYSGQERLGRLIRRYPYLYEHCLLSEDSTQAHQHTIHQLQQRAQRQFEVDLSQYVTYRLRRSRLGRQQAGVASQTPREVDNPTLLSDRDLVTSLKQFTGPVEQGHSYRDLAQGFATHSSHTRTYRAFKSDLYHYITASLDVSYGNRQFNQLLATHLQNLMADDDDRPLTDFLQVRTYSQLLNFLVIDSSQQPQHFVFVDLISNLGPVLTAGLLLKITLLCRRVKPHLERRFSLLFGHYEDCAQEAVQWLVQMLEVLNVALSLNFGRVSLPI